jgi:hypothetical protein
MTEFCLDFEFRRRITADKVKISNVGLVGLRAFLQ